MNEQTNEQTNKQTNERMNDPAWDFREPGEWGPKQSAEQEPGSRMQIFND